MKQGIKEKDIKKFQNACERLAKVIEDIQEYNPEAHMFCNMDSLELHGCRCDGEKDYHELEAVVSVLIKGTDCGER